MYRGFGMWSMRSTLMDQGWLVSLFSSLVIQLDALFIRSVRTINNISFHQRHRSRSSLHSIVSSSFISAKNQIWWKPSQTSTSDEQNTSGKVQVCGLYTTLRNSSWTGGPEICAKTFLTLIKPGVSNSALEVIPVALQCLIVCL